MPCAMTLSSPETNLCSASVLVATVGATFVLRSMILYICQQSSRLFGRFRNLFLPQLRLRVRLQIRLLFLGIGIF